MEDFPREESMYFQLPVSVLLYIVLPFLVDLTFGFSSLKTNEIITFNGSCTLTVYTYTIF